MHYIRLRELRKKNNLTQKQMATKLSMSQTGYSKYETGENDIPTSVLIKFSKIYDVSVDYILGLSNDPTIMK